MTAWGEEGWVTTGANMANQERRAARGANGETGEERREGCTEGGDGDGSGFCRGRDETASKQGGRDGDGSAGKGSKSRKGNSRQRSASDEGYAGEDSQSIESNAASSRQQFNPRQHRRGNGWLMVTGGKFEWLESSLLLDFSLDTPSVAPPACRLWGRRALRVSPGRHLEDEEG